MEDRDIIALYWNRDETAIARTAEKYGARLLRIGTNMVSEEDAEECVNDTYLAAWQQIPPVRPLHFFAWLAKVCRNAVCNRITWNRAQKRSASMVALEEELGECLPQASAEEEVEALELGRSLSRFLWSLPEEKRVFFLRRYWYGDSVREIAEAAACGESRVKVTLHRTRKELKKWLEKEGYGV